VQDNILKSAFISIGTNSYTSIRDYISTCHTHLCQICGSDLNITCIYNNVSSLLAYEFGGNISLIDSHISINSQGLCFHISKSDETIPRNISLGMI